MNSKLTWDLDFPVVITPYSISNFVIALVSKLGGRELIKQVKNWSNVGFQYVFFEAFFSTQILCPCKVQAIKLFFLNNSQARECGSAVI